MQTKYLVILAGILAMALVAGCTSSTTVRDDDPNNEPYVEGGGKATPGFEGPLAFGAVGAAALAVSVLRRRKA